MSGEGKKIHKALCKMFDGSQKYRLCDIYQSFKQCSKDKANGKYLVSSEVKAINFDKLTEWLFPDDKPQSADSLAFTDDDIYLIEFKAGDQVGLDKKRQVLIKKASGKINDSAETLYKKVLPLTDDLDTPRIGFRFYLVVDSDVLGIDPLTSILAKLSLGGDGLTNLNDQKLFRQVLPELKTNTDYPDRFHEIDIWYSAWFDRYLENHKIKDIRKMT